MHSMCYCVSACLKIRVLSQTIKLVILRAMPPVATAHPPRRQENSLRAFVTSQGRSGCSAGIAWRFKSLARCKQQASPTIGGDIQAPIHFDGSGRAMRDHPTSHPTNHPTAQPSNQQVGRPNRLPTTSRGRRQIERLTRQPEASRGGRCLCREAFRSVMLGCPNANPTSDPANLEMGRALVCLTARFCKDPFR